MVDNATVHNAMVDKATDPGIVGVDLICSGIGRRHATR